MKKSYYSTFKNDKSLDDSLINQVLYDIFIFQETPSLINEIYIMAIKKNGLIMI